MTPSKSQSEKIDEMYTLLCDNNNGICKQMQKFNETLYGNGHMGLTTKISIVWYALWGVWIVSLTILGAWLKKMV